MTYLAESPGQQPIVDLGCGTWCQFNYVTLITSIASMLIVLAVGFLIARRLTSDVPGPFQMMFETAYGYMRGQVRDVVAEDARFVVPLAMTIAFFILVANWLDFIPLSIFNVGEGALGPANADINVTASMAILVIVLVQAYSIRVLGFRGYLRRFTKPFEQSIPVRVLFTPLNIIEEVAKPISLSLRLFGNIFAGGVMVYLITLLLGSLPFGDVGHGISIAGIVIGSPFLAVWKLFDVLFIGAIQAYIFGLLTIIYFGMAREGLEEHH
jgi:F-type H+-transporting ATPase subunit a